MKLKKILGFLFVLFGYIPIYSSDFFDDAATKMHQNVLSEYNKIKSTVKFYDYAALQDLFNVIAVSDQKYLKKLEKYIYTIKKIIKIQKKNQEFSNEYSIFLKDLQILHSFLKKYRLQIEIVSFHHATKKDWNDLMQLVDKGEDILPVLPSKGITKNGVKGLKEFINKMNKALRIVEQYETRLHTDWIDLKLINYVLKIELIRLRNAAIFHPIYRGMPIETNYPR